ncbi:MAG: dihydropteroate synthase [Defluviitaleaceae bacterium]|nr:dihydropteroate synthase [Defluviitaleaceae bacterium]
MQIGSKIFDIGSRTFIVGILNVTPDSFFDGGSYDTIEQAVLRAKKMVDDGADIIEIGGESSRPGFKPVETNIELDRVMPVIKELKKVIGVPIAVDTYKSEVAEAALQNGASIINDVMCFKKDPELPKVCAKYNAVCVIMHNRNNTDYDNLLLDVMQDIKEGIELLTQAGVNPGKVIIDPGIGFAKTVSQNLEILRNLSFFSAYPYPVMLGASRKSFIGHTLGFSVEDRLEATLATTAMAISQHCHFIRVHDVLENKRVAMMADEIIRHKH